MPFANAPAILRIMIARPFERAILRLTLVLNLSSISADKGGTRDHKVLGDLFRLVALDLCLMKPRETDRENPTICSR
jgi:hypothetical protein